MSEFYRFEEMSDKLKQYLIINYEIIKCQAAERASVVGSTFISAVIIAVFGFMFLLILSIALGFYLSSMLNNSYAGFLIVAGFYLMLTLLLYAVRNKKIEKPMRDKIIQKLLNSN